jgi:hypothetical protein
LPRRSKHADRGMVAPSTPKSGRPGLTAVIGRDPCLAALEGAVLGPCDVSGPLGAKGDAMSEQTPQPTSAGVGNLVENLRVAGKLVDDFPEVREALMRDPVAFLEKYALLDLQALGVSRQDLPSVDLLRDRIARGERVAIAVCAVVV